MNTNPMLEDRRQKVVCVGDLVHVSRAAGAAPERAKVVAVHGDELSSSRTVDVCFKKDSMVMTSVGIAQIHTTHTDRLLRNKCCVWLHRNRLTCALCCLGLLGLLLSLLFFIVPCEVVITLNQVSQSTGVEKKVVVADVFTMLDGSYSLGGVGAGAEACLDPTNMGCSNSGQPCTPSDTSNCAGDETCVEQAWPKPWDVNGDTAPATGTEATCWKQEKDAAVSLIAAFQEKAAAMATNKEDAVDLRAGAMMFSGAFILQPAPTAAPSRAPTGPTQAPSSPTKRPTPAAEPTFGPTRKPTAAPSARPSRAPTAQTPDPTAVKYFYK